MIGVWQPVLHILTLYESKLENTPKFNHEDVENDNSVLFWIYLCSGDQSQSLQLSASPSPTPNAHQSNVTCHPCRSPTGKWVTFLHTLVLVIMSSCEQVFRSNWTCQIKQVKIDKTDISYALGKSDTNSCPNEVKKSESEIIQVATTVAPNEVKKSVDKSSEIQVQTRVNVSTYGHYVPDRNVQSDSILEDTPYGCFGGVNESNYFYSTSEVKHADSDDEVFQIQFFMYFAINISTYKF